MWILSHHNHYLILEEGNVSLCKEANLLVSLSSLWQSAWEREFTIRKGLLGHIVQRFHFMITWLFSWTCGGARHQDVGMGVSNSIDGDSEAEREGARRKVYSTKGPLRSATACLVGFPHPAAAQQVLSSSISRPIDEVTALMVQSLPQSSISEHFIRDKLSTDKALGTFLI